MVKVEIVEDKDQRTAGSSPYSSPSSSRTSSSTSLSSVSSELNDEETLFERIGALIDIIPPTTRHSISTKVSKAASFMMRGGKLAGNIVWVVTTSALLVGLPLAMTLEDEAKIVAEEKAMLAQQQGAQGMIAGYPGSSPDGSQPKPLVPPGF
ncbi:mitochondrial import translocase subunit Tom22 [Heliocybe sulcata]|uniref:Mitochondrial import translocase subunit Tom22 n=1 Tax=Heliocybe sulcata TaxID=5364 RepID=A0A5C3NFI0_9AGAM|nr:mitochondrial import translocase subunit Tom22 [Heliocybe sulcata]